MWNLVVYCFCVLHSALLTCHIIFYADDFFVSLIQQGIGIGSEFPYLSIFEIISESEPESELKYFIYPPGQIVYFLFISGLNFLH